MRAIIIKDEDAAVLLDSLDLMKTRDAYIGARVQSWNTLPESLRRDALTAIHGMLYNAVRRWLQDQGATVVVVGQTAQPPAVAIDDTGMDTPWPLPEVLARLIAAADHLLQHHGCDCHGYESAVAAKNAARKWLAERGWPTPFQV